MDSLFSNLLVVFVVSKLFDLVAPAFALSLQWHLISFSLSMPKLLEYRIDVTKVDLRRQGNSNGWRRTAINLMEVNVIILLARTFHLSLHSVRFPLAAWKIAKSFKWKNFAGIFLSAFLFLFVPFLSFCRAAVAAAKHSFDRKTVSAIYVDIFSSFYALAFDFLFFLQFRTFASSVVRPQCRTVSIPWSDELKRNSRKKQHTHSFKI